MNLDDSATLGHGQIDAEHRSMLLHLNALVEQVFGGESRSAGPQDNETRRRRIEATIDALRQATAEHVASEEALMAAAGFPGIKSHVEQHAELLDQLARFAENFHATSTESLPHVIRFFREWFEFHHDTYDRALVRWLDAERRDQQPSA